MYSSPPRVIRKEKDMNYYEKIIQEKKNSKYHYKLIDEGYLGILKDEGQHKWTVQSWYGTNLLDEQRVIGPKSKAESAGERNIRSFEQRHKTNSKEEKDNESVVERYAHNGAVIEIIKTDSGKFRSRISKKGKTEETMTVSGTRMEAKRDAEETADTMHNEKGYYQSIIEEKKAKQNGPDEDNKVLEKIAPVLVRKYKRSQAPALTPKEVAILLEERNRFPSTLAQQAVQMWYDHV